jgi:hypothetical protein
MISHPKRCETCNRSLGKPAGTNDCPLGIPSHLDVPEVYIIEVVGCASHSPVENGTPVTGWNSTRLIGNVEERYEQVKHYGKTHSLKGEEWDWQSFYNGWIEGRLAMSAELRNGDVRLCNDCPFKPDHDCAAYLYRV